MKFVEKINRELMDVEVPGIFVTTHMMNLSEISLKLYIYIKFLSKNGICLDEESISKTLGVSVVDIDKAFDALQEEELVIRTIEGYEILDVKEQEINKIYVPKLKVNKSPRTIAEKKRLAAAQAINETFFRGVMSMGWFTDIATLFDKYNFDGEVMVALFHECSERNALKKNYVFKVAESWNKGGVKTFDELEDYQNKQTKLNNVMQKMKSKLRLNRSFTEYEEAFIASWINEFKYDFDIVDFAIQKTSSKGAPTIGYINGILKNWHESGLSTLNDIMQKEENKAVPRQRVTVGVSNNLNHKNYEQRKDIDLNEFYDT